jgi:ATP-binding cassette, subfamily B (MDR/TAP), member 1
MAPNSEKSVENEKATDNGASTRPSSHGESTEKAAPDKDVAVDLAKADSRVAVPGGKEDDADDAFAHLPPGEAEILKRQVVMPQVKAGVAALYRYSSRNDALILAVSVIAAIASGAAMPLMTVIFGNLQGTFTDYFLGRTTKSEFNDEMVKYVLYFVYLAIGEFVCVYIMTVGFICKSSSPIGAWARDRPSADRDVAWRQIPGSTSAPRFASIISRAA